MRKNVMQRPSLRAQRLGALRPAAGDNAPRNGSPHQLVVAFAGEGMLGRGHLVQLHAEPLNSLIRRKVDDWVPSGDLLPALVGERCRESGRRFRCDGATPATAVSCRKGGACPRSWVRHLEDGCHVVRTFRCGLGGRRRSAERTRRRRVPGTVCHRTEGLVRGRRWSATVAGGEVRPGGVGRAHDQLRVPAEQGAGVGPAQPEAE